MSLGDYNLDKPTFSYGEGGGVKVARGFIPAWKGKVHQDFGVPNRMSCETSTNDLGLAKDLINQGDIPHCVRGALVQIRPRHADVPRLTCSIWNNKTLEVTFLCPANLRKFLFAATRHQANGGAISWNGHKMPTGFCPLF